MAEATRARRATWPFLLVGGAWFAVMAGSNLATPLYAGYEQRFGFSSAVLTVVFATYALVLAPSLLVFGQLSDRLPGPRGHPPRPGVGPPRAPARHRRRPGRGRARADPVRARRRAAVAVRRPRHPGAVDRDDQRRGG